MQWLFVHRRHRGLAKKLIVNHYNWHHLHRHQQSGRERINSSQLLAFKDKRYGRTTHLLYSELTINLFSSWHKRKDFKEIVRMSLHFPRLFRWEMVPLHSTRLQAYFSVHTFKKCISDSMSTYSWWTCPTKPRGSGSHSLLRNALFSPNHFAS